MVAIASLKWLELCGETNPWAKFHENPVFPPSFFKSSTFDLIYAYSVFSHLSESAHKAWLKEFHRILKNGGILVVTTRERGFINNLNKPPYPSDTDIRCALRDYDAGRFVHIPTGGGFNLSKNFYGEAAIPRTYVNGQWSILFDVRCFLEGIQYIDQNVIIAVKN